MKKNILKDNVNAVAFFNILGPIVLNGINFFTIPIFTRVLGTDNYGLYTIYSTWVSVATILIGLQVMGTVGVANVQFLESDKKKYYSSICTLIMVSFCAFFIMMILCMPWLTKYMGLPRKMIILMSVHALGMAFVNLALNRYTYEKKAHLTFALSVGIAVSGIALSFLFFTQISDKNVLYYGRAYGYAVPYILLGFLLCVVYIIQGKTAFSKKYWSFCLTLCLPMVFHGLSQLILSQADKVMLQNIMSDGIVGIYSFTFTFAHVMNIIYNSFNNTWVPFYYEDMKAGKFDSIHRRTKNYVFIFTGLSIGFILLAPEVIKLFANEDFWSGIPLVTVFVLANYMMFLYSFPVNFEFYHKKSIHIAIGTCSAAIINCILNYLWIPIWGMTGAAMATLVSYILLWIFHHLAAKYFIREEYHYRLYEFLPGLITMIGFVVLVTLLLEKPVIRWGIAVIVAVVMLRHLIKTKSIF